jgi:predicted regulator of Ras-like GTPase activity (Roadblock/LC7/MglB family)
MSLRDTLKSIVENVDGGIAIVIVAHDGISIDEVVMAQTSLDIQLLSVEYATVLKEIRRAVEVTKAGDLEEVTITTGQTRFVIRVLNEELFAVLIMTADGNFGKGRYLLRLKAGDLSRELT